LQKAEEKSPAAGDLRVGVSSPIAASLPPSSNVKRLRSLAVAAAILLVVAIEPVKLILPMRGCGEEQAAGAVTADELSTPVCGFPLPAAPELRSEFSSEPSCTDLSADERLVNAMAHTDFPPTSRAGHRSLGFWLVAV
jgi:hypothetical protein